MGVIDIDPVRERFSAVAPFLDERGRRLVAAAEAFAAGYGGIAAVAMATGVAPSTIGRGLKELAQDEPSERVRRPGAGRKPTISKDPTLLADLEALVEPTSRGDPESPLRWTCKSVRRLAQALQAQGHEVSRTLVGHLLNEAGYSLQGNRKTTEGDSHPDRDAQFGYINNQVTAALAEHQPVISVDTKKKELVGDFRNNGREYCPQGNPEEVRVHDFLIKELGRAVPYGIYDLAANSGWVSVGVDHDTAAFAVNSIRQWWQAVGRARYPNASRLLITADGGGSNGSRVRLWKRELQKLANERVCQAREWPTPLDQGGGDPARRPPRRRTLRPRLWPRDAADWLVSDQIGHERANRHPGAAEKARCRCAGAGYGLARSQGSAPHDHYRQSAADEQRHRVRPVALWRLAQRL